MDFREALIKLCDHVGGLNKSHASVVRLGIPPQRLSV